MSDQPERRRADSPEPAETAPLPVDPTATQRPAEASTPAETRPMPAVGPAGPQQPAETRPIPAVDPAGAQQPAETAPMSAVDPAGAPRPTETAPMSAVDADGAQEPAETKAMPALGPTEVRRPTETAPMSAVDPVAGRRVDETRPMPAALAEPAVRPEAPAWSGRAQVRPPRPQDEYVEAGWTPEAAAPAGRWWTPILVGIIALILLGLLGWGIAMIVQNSGDTEEAPAPTASSVAAPAPRESIVASQAPSSAPPSTTPSTTDPAVTEVKVPALRGMSVEDARDALDRSGLAHRVIRRPSAAAAPGTVIDSDPPEGALVPADTRITLIVAAERSSGPATAPVSSGATGETDED